MLTDRGFSRSSAPVAQQSSIRNLEIREQKLYWCLRAQFLPFVITL